MPFCPTCGAAYRAALPECPYCHVALIDTLPDQSVPSSAASWITVYKGCGIELRLVEERLLSQGLTVTRLHAESVQYNSRPLHLGGDFVHYKLAIPEDQYLQRRQELEALIAAVSGSEEDPAAILEAEEDYDVRGCPRCILYFHENYAVCPGCDTELVPAVECFEDGQMEPDRVIVAHGSQAAVKALEARLKAAGFDAQAFEVEGWTVDGVDLPWSELTGRTTEAEVILGLHTATPAVSPD